MKTTRGGNQEKTAKAASAIENALSPSGGLSTLRGQRGQIDPTPSGNIRTLGGKKQRTSDPLICPASIPIAMQSSHE